MHPTLPLAIRFLVPAALALAVSTGPAIARNEKSKADALRPVGEPITCILPHNIRATHVIDDQTIDFEMNNGALYRNRLPYSCPPLGFEQRFSYKLSTSQLCSVDIITVLENFGGSLSQGPSCGLGTFQKMEKAPK